MEVKLNPEPTDVQLALFRRHKKAGTTPGNPRWYTKEATVIRPFVFKAGQPPVYKRLPTGAAWNAAHNSMSVRKGTTLSTRYTDGTVLERVI